MQVEKKTHVEYILIYICMCIYIRIIEYILINICMCIYIRILYLEFKEKRGQIYKFH